MSLMGVIAAAIGLAGVVSAVVLYVRRSTANRVELDEQSAALGIEKSRVASEEAAAAAERVARQRVFDGKAAAVRTSADAANLLRDATSEDTGHN